jgi:hypothetical protein
VLRFKVSKAKESSENERKAKKSMIIKTNEGDMKEQEGDKHERARLDHVNALGPVVKRNSVAAESDSA